MGTTSICTSVCLSVRDKMSVTFQTMMSVPSGFTKCPSLFTFRCLSTLYFKMSVTFYLQTSVPTSDKKCLLSKPKLNQDLSSIEFEVRLHSYSDIPPTTPPGTIPQQAAGRDLCVQLYSHCQCSHSVQIQLEMYRQVSTVFLWHRLSFCEKFLNRIIPAKS